MEILAKSWTKSTRVSPKGIMGFVGGGKEAPGLLPATGCPDSGAFARAGRWPRLSHRCRGLAGSCTSSLSEYGSPTGGLDRCDRPHSPTWRRARITLTRPLETFRTQVGALTCEMHANI